MAQRLTAEMIDKKLNGARDDLRPVAFGLRSAIEALAPDLQPVSAWSFVCYCGNDRVFSVIPYKNWVNLQLWHGAELADPQKLIEGTGKRLRHVKCRTVDDIARPELKAVMEAAISYDSTLAIEGIH